jgi:hypothetical protein
LAVKFSREAPDGFVAHSFCGDDWRACRDHIAALLGISAPAPTVRGKAASSPIAPVDDHEQKRRKAAHLWRCRSPVEGSPVEAYLRKARGYLGPIPPTIGYLKPGAYYWPAMIAAFGHLADEGEIGIDRVRGIHLTFLDDDGSGKAAIDTPKRMLGPSSGFPIVVADINDGLGLAITEGIEDALSVHAATGLGAWAAGSSGRMPALNVAVPDYVECVTICAHADTSGRRGAYQLADALLARGIEVFLEGITA